MSQTHISFRKKLWRFFKKCLSFFCLICKIFSGLAYLIIMIGGQETLKMPENSPFVESKLEALKRFIEAERKEGRKISESEERDLLERWKHGLESYEVWKETEYVVMSRLAELSTKERDTILKHESYGKPLQSMEEEEEYAKIRSKIEDVKLRAENLFTDGLDAKI